MSFKAFVKVFLKKVFKVGPETIEDYRKRGVRIGENVELISCDVDYGHGYLIEIGDNCIITHTTILSHDASTKIHLGYSKVGRVKIGSNVFIGQGSVVLPGVTIGDNVVVGAGTVVRDDIPDNSVVMGNPMKIICTMEHYIEKHKQNMLTYPVYTTYWEDKSEEEKQKMIKDLEGGRIGYDV